MVAAAGRPRRPAAPAFGAKPVTVKLGKVTKTSAVALTLTSEETFAFTGKATLQTAKKPKAQSKAASFSLAMGKSGKVTLKLNAAGKKGQGQRRSSSSCAWSCRSGVAKKMVDVKVTLRAR